MPVLLANPWFWGAATASFMWLTGDVFESDQPNEVNVTRGVVIFLAGAGAFAVVRQLAD